MRPRQGGSSPWIDTSQLSPAGGRAGWLAGATNKGPRGRWLWSMMGLRCLDTDMYRWEIQLVIKTSDNYIQITIPVQMLFALSLPLSAWVFFKNIYLSQSGVDTRCLDERWLRGWVGNPTNKGPRAMMRLWSPDRYIWEIQLVTKAVDAKSKSDADTGCLV